MEIDKIKVCKPIENLVDVLRSNGFEITESRVSDYHFHEIFIRLKGNRFDSIQNINIDKIKKVDNKSFACDCHWSIVELDRIDKYNIHKKVTGEK